MGGARYGLAFAAGTIAAVNPCGFALLPAYLTLFVTGADRGPSGVGGLRRAVVATAAMTGGFVVVFGAFGLVVAPAAGSVQRFLPWASVVIGVLLTGVGGWLLAGRELRVPGPKVGIGRDPTSSAAAMAGYGISFAVASLSCTVGPFLALTTTALHAGGAGGVIGVFFAYAAGMGAVVGSLTLSAALARDAFTLRLRRALPWVNRAGGALLLAAGVYAAWYGIFEIRVLHGHRGGDPVVNAAGRWQADAARWVHAMHPVVLVGSGVVLGVLVRWLGRRDRTRPVGPAGSGAINPGPHAFPGVEEPGGSEESGAVGGAR